MSKNSRKKAMQMIDYDAEFERIYENFLIKEKENLKDVKSYSELKDLYLDDYLEGRKPNKFQDRILPDIYQRLISGTKETRITTIEVKKEGKGKAKSAVQRRILDKPARVKGSLVYTGEEKILRKRKEIIIYRDAKGRFAKIIKK